MRDYILDLSITPDELHRYYSGKVITVVARARSGLTVRFAARHLRQHVTRNGIRGTFRLTTDDQNRFISLDALSPKDAH